MDKRICRYCQGEFGINGIGRHEKACTLKQPEAARNADVAEQLQEVETQALAREFAERKNDFLLDDSDASASVSRPGSPLEEEPPRRPQLNDIKRVFHPHSGRQTIVESLHEYRTSQVRPKRRPPIDAEPWAPFRTRLDFEVAEFTQDVMLNQAQINTLISLIRRCSANIADFTFHSHADINKSWNLASKKCTQFVRSEVSVPYKGADQVFEMYARPLWDWALDIITDPHMADFFVWDAEQVFRYNGKEYVRFFTEPWTGDAMWDVQSKLPEGPDIKPCPFIIYADKAKLSSFSTQKGYPIVARLANVVVSLRNSEDWGGGQVVGWLPVIEDDEAEAGKTGYTNFKNAVWHASFFKLLESIALRSKTGAWVQCGDGKERSLHPMILILASDYEEACVMTLIRGLKALYPCPMCYVKNEDQSDMTQLPALRTSEQSQHVIQQARQAKTAEARENILKKHSLRNVDNVFWKVAYSDPHYASSFEHLHAYGSGLWGKHLFEQTFPRWRDLSHFNSVMSITFNDATKHEDVCKVMLLATHHLLTDEVDLALLKVVRSFQELNMYVTLKLHTADTIGAGREELLNFGKLMEQYIEACSGTELDDGKGWNFPKIHSHTHVFDDIERKGVARNFGTKIDESMHAAARNTYLRQTNFKNVAPQILRADHRRLVGKRIRDQLNDLDEIFRQEWEGEPEEEEIGTDPEQLDNVVIGAPDPVISLQRLEELKRDDTAFRRFRIRLAEFLSNSLLLYGHALPEGKHIKLILEDQIIPHKFLKVFYPSMDHWADVADYLRCNPHFHGHPRFDAALVKTAGAEIFVRLIYAFKIELSDKNAYRIALVQPLDAPIGRISRKDQALKLIRIRAKPRQEAEFIFVRSIIRGAVLAPAHDRDGDFMVMDVLDGDMFLRLKSMYPDRR
ncbi:hypothetical protein FB451DRAFT_1340298 [Mycena latifolia]|nr:hypothetical protein FB451DRAFT_1340298 [Mycena latifolia]